MSGRDERRASCLCGESVKRWTLFMGRNEDIKLDFNEKLLFSTPMSGPSRVLWYFERHGTDGLKTVSRIQCIHCHKTYLKNTQKTDEVIFVAKQMLIEKGFRVVGTNKICTLTEWGVFDTQ